eukprot:1179311-Prorocentrum_minimum.AAC.12
MTRHACVLHTWLHTNTTRHDTEHRTQNSTARHSTAQHSTAQHTQRAGNSPAETVTLYPVPIPDWFQYPENEPSEIHTMSYRARPLMVADIEVVLTPKFDLYGGHRHEDSLSMRRPTTHDSIRGRDRSLRNDSDPKCEKPGNGRSRTATMDLCGESGPTQSGMRNITMRIRQRVSSGKN